MNNYHQKIVDLLSEVHTTQSENLNQAALLIAQAMKNNGWLYVFGSGHSHMIAEEFFYRAGGMVRVYPIFDTALMLHEGAVKSSALERLSGYAESLLADYPITENDVILIASNSGRNALPIEMALEARKKNIKVICLTSLAHSQTVTSRHESGKRLFEVSDVVIDNCGEFGDACVSVGQNKIAPTSNVIGMYIVNSIVELVAKDFERMGIEGEFYQSSNTDSGEIKNQKFITKYKNFIRSL